MTMKQVEQALADKIMYNKDFILKFVDIGQGSGKLGNGVLQAEKADKYMQAVQEETAFLNKTKVVPTHNHKRELDMMSFDIELEAGRIGGTPQTLSDEQDPTFTNRAFDAEEYRALTGVHRTVLYDSIEQKNFMNTLTGQFGNANGRALERTLIYGNTASTESNVATSYKVNDGILKKLEDDSDIDQETIDLTATDSNPLKEFRRMLDLFPDKYKNDGGVAAFVPYSFKRAVWRYVADNHDKYAVNDVVITKDGDISIEEVPLVPIPAFSTLRNGFTKKPVILTHKENIQWLADPDNIIVESEFDLKSNKYYIASTMYADIQFAWSDASALAYIKEA